MGSKSHKYKMKHYKRHNFHTLNQEDLHSDLVKDGVVVIENIFSKQECDDYMERTHQSFQRLGTGINDHKISSNWQRKNLPPQTRSGLFQSIMGHIPPVWEVRRNENIINIFKNLYSKLRNLENIKLVPSIDGINCLPNRDIGKEKENTWEHLDQTYYHDPFKCIQGSIAFSNTSAGFLCSPKSHKIFDKILQIEKIADRENFSKCHNWCRIKEENKETVKFEIERAGGKYQLPIIVPAGSMILWFSSTLHSARGAIKKENKSPNDKWLGWRGVYYISYRPDDEFTDSEMEIIKRNTKENRSMNHWSTKTFSSQGRWKSTEQHP